MPHLPDRRTSLPDRLWAIGTGWLAVAAAVLLAAGPAAAQTAIITHHNNIARTGWNFTETVLTPQNVGTPGPYGTFGLLANVPLDDTADAQPLVVPNVVVSGDPNPGTHDVVYAATEGNTVYAIDPTRATVLLSRNLGIPVPMARGCGKNEDVGIGVTGTPVIDINRHALYLVSFVNMPVGKSDQFKRVYVLHMLDLSTLADRVPPVEIAGQQTMDNGATLTFAAGVERQRTALLETRGTIYVAFSAQCDAALGRGWVMGWSSDTLAPLASSGGMPVVELTNRQPTEPHGKFLSSIWMSGAGPAADAQGIYFVTGNSDKNGKEYNPVNNIEHSIVLLTHNTRKVLDLFTPSNLPYLDANDRDFGAGGVTLFPSIRAGEPPTAAAAGKFGTMYLVNRNAMGGYTPGGPDNVLASVVIGGCWCQPSYFDDGMATVVSSGGNQIMLWQLQALPTTTLVPRGVSPALNNSPLGFFTSVSSNGENDTIIWAVTHALNSTPVTLYAFGVARKPQVALTQLYVGTAGTWGAMRHLPSMVPVVANGRVYVVSDSGLAIFGLGVPQ